MALFGKKKADTAPANNSATNGGAAVVAAPARKVKASKASKSSASKGGTVVGLNIGNAYIKAVEVTSKGGQLSVTGMGVVATPPESYANGNVLSVTALTNALRAMWKQAGLSSKATVFSVAGTGSLVVRVIEVPRMTDGELADNMRVDADRYIPFPPSEVVMDVQALRDLPSDPDAANMEVLLAAAQREIIDLHVSVVQKAKLTPRAIDVEPLALARTMQLELRAQNPIIDYDDVTAILNIGQTGTEISILRGDIVVFTRSVPNGGGNLTSAIAETMGIPISDAERLKVERGDALPPLGYNTDEGQEEFGFGEFEDSSSTPDFSADDAVGTATATAAPDTTTSAQVTPASDDPFDLDFFDQGPQQSEPGAGHGQKEDDAEENPPGISFSFDSLDNDISPSRADEVKPAPSAPAPASEDAEPAMPPSMEDFDLPDTYLPAMDTSEATSDAPSTMPSAFDFSDFDLPTTDKGDSSAAPTQNLAASAPAEDSADAPVSFGFSEQESAAPAAATPLSFDKADEDGENSLDAENSAAPLDFGDLDNAATSDATIEASGAPIGLEKTGDEAAAPISLDKSDEPALAAEGDGFDLDDVFGAPASPVASQGVGAAGGGFDIGAETTGDFDVSALDMAGVETSDLSSFGTGLSQSGEADDATLYAAMQPVLDDLATEVRRSLEFHLGRYPDTTFSRLVLVGGGAKLRNLDEFLSGNLGVPTSVGDPFSHINVNAPGLPPEFVPTNSPLCAVALGLALRDFIE